MGAMTLYTSAMAAIGVAVGVTAGSASLGVESVPPTPIPRFEAGVSVIDESSAEAMRGVSWQPGCPVDIADLRLIAMNHWGFDGELHDGELVVHADVAEAMVSVFERLFDARFPIRRMERIERYGGDDDASMAADNTSAFNCRPITGGGSFSIHSRGKAVDINPLENPYVNGGVVLPDAGADYVDRSDVRPGMIVDGDVVVQAFADVGFEWGGDWNTLKDFQHFEAPDPGSSPTARQCGTYTEHAGRYPVRQCQRGAAVESVQRALVSAGFAIEVDGLFGPRTFAAVRDFQDGHGLPASGLVGPITWPVLLGESVTGTDADGNGVVDPWEAELGDT